jgi:hypothetical protein
MNPDRGVVKDNRCNEDSELFGDCFNAEDELISPKWDASKAKLWRQALHAKISQIHDIMNIVVRRANGHRDTKLQLAGTSLHWANGADKSAVGDSKHQYAVPDDNEELRSVARNADRPRVMKQPIVGVDHPRHALWEVAAQKPGRDHGVDTAKRQRHAGAPAENRHPGVGKHGSGRCICGFGSRAQRAQKAATKVPRGQRQRHWCRRVV